MRRMAFVGLLVFTPGCFLSKSPSQKYQVTSETFRTAYVSIIELSQAGYLSQKDMETVQGIKDAAKPLLDEYAEMVKKDASDPRLGWIMDRLRMFIVDVYAIEHKGKQRHTQARDTLIKFLDAPPIPVPPPTPEKKAEVIKDIKEM